MSAVGNDITGDGTIGNPYLTINRALTDAQNFGWNLTAEVRVLSTGGPFTLPDNLSVNTGTRGIQESALVIRGYNLNPVPGRTIQATDTVISAATDTISRLVTITATGPFVSGMVGMRLRFITGALTAFLVLDTTVPVDVPIVAVPSPTQLTIAFDIVPTPGDQFQIESIDTILVNNNVMPIHTAGTDIVIMQNFIVQANDTCGFFLQDGVAFQPVAVNIVPLTGASFIFTGLSNSMIFGGLIGTVGFSVTGLTPTTQSMFVDVSVAAVFAMVVGTLLSNSSGPSVALSNCGFMGNVQFAGNGFLQTSYFGSLAQASLSDNRLSLARVWFAAVDNSFTALQESIVNLTNVRFDSTTLNISNQTLVNGSTVSVFDGSISLSNSSSMTVTNLQLTGGSTLSARIILSDASSLQHLGNLLIPPSGTNGFVLSDGSRFVVNGNLTSATNSASGGVLLSSSELNVTGNLVINANNSNNLSVFESTLVIGGTLDVSTSTTGSGLIATRSRISIGGAVTASSNGGGNGILFIETEADIAGSIVASTNNTTGIAIQSQSTVSVIGDVVVLGPQGNIAPAISVSVDSEVQITGQTIVSDITVDLNSGAIFVQDASSLITGSIAMSLVRGSIVNIFVNRHSRLETTTPVNPSISIVGGTVIIDNSSEFLVTSGFNLSVTSTSALQIRSGSEATLIGVSTVSQAQVNGVLVEFGSRLIVPPGSTLQIDLSALEGLSLSSGSSAWINNLSGNGNGLTGAIVRNGSHLYVAAASITGTVGDVVVGVNATTTWANIFGGNPAFITDYLSGQNPTQLASAQSV